MISDTEAAAAAWVVSPGSTAGTPQVKVGGARAIGLAIAVGRDARWPTLPWKLPFRLIGLPWVLDRLYELVARYRNRLPGETPWCVEHPGECSPSPDS